MILEDKSIMEKMKQGEIIINPVPTQEQIQPCSVDLRLGSEYLAPIQSEDAIDTRNMEPKYQSLEGNAIILPPGQFILGTTKEYLEIPSNLIARVEGRSSIGRLGIAVHVTAGFIDAGFKGNITLELANLGNNNIILYENTRICQIVFEELKNEPHRVYGEVNNKYQNKKGVVGSLLYWDTENTPIK